MSREQVKFEAPVGKIFTQALREEATLDERNERFTRASKMRSLADRIDFLSNIMKGKKRV